MKDLWPKPDYSKRREDTKRGRAYPDRVQCDSEEVIEKDEGIFDDASEQADGAVDAGSAELEVPEAAEL